MAKSSPYLSEQVGDHEPATTLNWRELVAIVIERAWMGLTVAILVFLYFWFQAYRQVPYYRSTATLMVEAQIPQLFNFQDVVSFNTRNLEYFNTHIKSLHSRAIMERAIEHGELAGRPNFTPGRPEGPGQIEMALRFVNIVPVERSRMIEIVVEHPDPGIAADLANAMAEAYIQQDLNNRMGMSLQAVDWLRSRAEEYRENLEQGLAELQQYREETQSVSLEEDQNIVIAKLKAVNSALTSAQTARIEAETRWRALEDLMAQDVPVTEAALTLNDGTVSEAYGRVRERRQRAEALQQRYRAGHPDYQAAADELRAAEEQFEVASRRAIASIENAYRIALLREQNLATALREQEQEAFELDRKLVRYNDLRRNVEAEQEVYQAIISRMKEASLSGTLPTEIIRLVEAAEPARNPFRPNPRQAMTRGASLGISLGLAAIFLLYFADHRYRRVEEVERSLGLPSFGSLPLIRSKSLKHRGLIVHEDDTGSVSEAFRTLRASIMMSPAMQRAKTWMISSAGPGEGKTLVVTNLAISLAQDGQRTLLIGADLRRPTVHKLFESKHQLGLTDVLEGKCKISSAIEQTAVKGLDLMPAGRIPSHPAELMSKQIFPQAMESLSKEYDRILIDAPPVLGVSDALILLGYVEAVIFVVRYGVTHSLAARHALSKIEASGTRCEGTVLNGVNLRNMANYYYYRRYGGYGYNYEPSKTSEVVDTAAYSSS